MTAILEVERLTTAIVRARDSASVVESVDLVLEAGRTLALVGESGSGKSVTALSIMRLLPDPPMRITGGSVRLAGRELTALDETAMCAVRGGGIAMIFQEPMSSLNPVMPVGVQVAEALRVHHGASRLEARREAIALLQKVRIPDAPHRVDDYPHRFSGGMRQRVMIAIALAGGPRVLIADEPTTALDVTVEAQIMQLLASLQAELGLAMLLITHNLALVANHAESVAVMYAGRIVETGRTGSVLHAARHPYTRALLGARPGARRARLIDIPGAVPAPGTVVNGCSFAPRCTFAVDRCRVESPRLAEGVACHRAGEIG